MKMPIQKYVWPIVLIVSGLQRPTSSSYTACLRHGQDTRSLERLVIVIVIVIVIIIVILIVVAIVINNNIIMV